MMKCEKCNKKIGFLGGYNEGGKTYCKECFSKKRNKNKKNWKSDKYIFETLVNTYAKIISIIIFLFIAIVFLGELLNKSFPLYSIFLSIVALILFFPLFYYAWSKKDNKRVIIFGKIITSFVTIFILLLLFFLIILLFFSPQEIELIAEMFDLVYLFLFLALFFYFPVYYYSWKNKNKKNKQKVSLWLKTIPLIFIGLYILSLYHSYLVSEVPWTIAESFGDLVGTILGTGLLIIFGSTCSRWAKEIDKNVNIAYAIGFFLAIFGLIGYYIIYRRNIKS